MATKNPLEDRALHEKVANLIRAGRLPARRPDRIWGGPGVGAECAVCGAPITAEDVEMELEFTAGDGRGASRHHLHVRCYAALEEQSRNLRALAAAAPEITPRPPAGGGTGGSATRLQHKA